MFSDINLLCCDITIVKLLMTYLLLQSESLWQVKTFFIHHTIYAWLANLVLICCVPIKLLEVERYTYDAFLFWLLLSSTLATISNTCHLCVFTVCSYRTLPTACMSVCYISNTCLCISWFCGDTQTSVINVAHWHACSGWCLITKILISIKARDFAATSRLCVCCLSHPIL